MTAGDRARALGHVQEGTRFALIISVAGFVVLGANGSAILATLFSSAYIDGDRFLRLQLAGFGLFAVLDVFSSSLMAIGRQRLVAVLTAVIVPAVWLSNLVLIRRFGPMGAVASMMAGLALGVAIMGVLARRCFGPVFRPRTLLRVTLAGLIVEVVSSTFNAGGPAVLLKISALLVIYLCVLLASGEITWKELGLRTGRPAPSTS
jgi:O-antigen/teichoic acid export membrane protein